MLPKKLYLHDSDYRVEMKNGKEHTYNFKNVFITELPPGDNGTPQVFIPIRVFRESEEDDMLLARLMTESIEKYHENKTRKKRTRRS